MPLPPAVGTVTIDYDLRRFGVTGNGIVQITVPYALRDTTDHVILGPGVIVAPVVDGIGSIVIPDPNDPDVSPQGWAPHVQILTDVYNDRYDILIPPGSTGQTLHLSDIPPAVLPTPPALAAFALVSHTHSGGGGGSVPDATTGIKGIVQLAGDFGGTAASPTVPALAGKYVKPGGGIPSTDLTAAVQTNLTKASTAVQAGALATVATSGSAADLIGILPAVSLPAIAVTEYLGAAVSQAAMLALVGQLGDWCTRTDLGTNWVVTGADPTQLSSWTALTYPASPVVSVAGKTGAVSLVKGDVGLGNVDNTSDAGKPVSTATQTALDAKQARSILTTKGDLYVATSAATVARLAVGSDNQVLTADATQTAGVKWATPSGGSSTIAPAWPATAGGFAAWSGEPREWTLQSTFGDNNITWVRLYVPPGPDLVDALVCVGTAGTQTPNGNPCMFKILTDDGATKLGETADTPSLYTVAGWRSAALLTPIPRPSGVLLHLGIIAGGVSGAKLLYPDNSSTYDPLISAGTAEPLTARWRCASGSGSTLPDTINPVTGGGLTRTGYIPQVALR